MGTSRKRKGKRKKVIITEEEKIDGNLSLKNGKEDITCKGFLRMSIFYLI